MNRFEILLCFIIAFAVSTIAFLFSHNGKPISLKVATFWLGLVYFYMIIISIVAFGSEFILKGKLIIAGVATMISGLITGFGFFYWRFLAQPLLSKHSTLAEIIYFASIGILSGFICPIYEVIILPKILIKFGKRIRKFQFK